MKHHDLKNKILFEKLAKQYSKGEVKEGLWDTLKKRAQKEFGPTAQNTDPMEDPVYSDLMKRMDQMKPGEKKEKEKEVKDKLEDQEEKLKQFANQTLTLLSDAGIEESDQIYRDIVRAMETAQRAINRSQQDVDIPDLKFPMSDPTKPKKPGVPEPVVGEQNNKEKPTND